MSACQSGFNDQRALPALDEPYFRCRVQPVLAKSCSMLVCHGDGRRFFRVYARNRLRLGGTELGRNAPLSDAERTSNYDAARAFVGMSNPTEDYLLLKPLELAAGGRYHQGAVIFGGGNVFLTRDEPDYQTLQSWVNGAKEDPACIEPGSDQ